MGRKSALEANKILSNTRLYNTREGELLALERTISDCINMNKATTAKVKKLISILEKLSDLSFDVGKVDNIDLLNFLNNPFGQDIGIFEAIQYAHGEINPKSYGYCSIKLT